jgi:hypothetical protein
MLKPFLISLLAISYNVVAQAPVRLEWKQNFKNSLNSINKAVAVDFDRAGNVYVLGQTWQTDSTKDVIVIKYNPAGQEIWRRIYDDPKRGDDIPFAMKVDGFENVWVTGMARLTEENADFFILRFSSDGIPVDLMFDGKDHLFDCGTAITTDSLGYAFAGGYTTSVDSGLNIRLYKINPEMKVVWSTDYATREMDIVARIKTDDSSNVYVAGNIQMGPHSSDVLLMKLDRDGKEKWQYIFDGKMHENDMVSKLEFDDSSNVFLAGHANHVNSRSDVFILKFNSSGKLLMEKYEYGKVADNDVSSFTITADHLFIAGSTNDYNLQQVYSNIYSYTKGGEPVKSMRSAFDNRFMRYFEFSGTELILGSKTVDEMIIPFIAAVDSAGQFSWTFADSTIFGETHMIDVQMNGGSAYFLGDDAGEATGTITLLKYSLYLSPPEEKPKSPVISKPHKYR